MKFPRIARAVPSWKNALLAVISAILLILAFPDFEYWFLAWFGLGPLLAAIERQKGSSAPAFVLGWVWGVVFFFGTCWWLTYAPIHYAAFPWPLAYFLLFWVVAVAAVFPGLFAAITSVLLRWFGARALLAAPFVWVATEFARYWITGNDWNAIGYSQAFFPVFRISASIGGVLIVCFICCAISCGAFFLIKRITWRAVLTNAALWLCMLSFFGFTEYSRQHKPSTQDAGNEIIAVQPNVPMSGLDFDQWHQLRQRQINLAQLGIAKQREYWTDNYSLPTTVILPESPMNYQWDEDPEFQRFIGAFAAGNNVSVLFNSAEPDPENHKYFNSAVMIDQTGREIAEYDKIYLLPFGEAVPVPLDSVLPGFVGNFSYGKNYNLVPLGDAKAGIMICFESHFGQLSREYVRRGADAIIEMTNDGYLGPTPVLRQHLANAVFRAIETNRPVLRVTNVGITAYITERGEVLDATQPYTEDTRVWSVAKSDGSQTFYVMYGDWFAWLCTGITAVLLVLGSIRRPSDISNITSSGT
jgi:apolipoprotein N-acyltransferase